VPPLARGGTPAPGALAPRVLQFAGATATASPDGGSPASDVRPLADEPAPLAPQRGAAGGGATAPPPPPPPSPPPPRRPAQRVGLVLAGSHGHVIAGAADAGISRTVGSEFLPALAAARAALEGQLAADAAGPRRLAGVELEDNVFSLSIH
jgi:trehalose-phosphatase